MIFSVLELVEQIYKYSRDNLALVNVYIKNPVVTKIRLAPFMSYLDIHLVNGVVFQERPENSCNLVCRKLWRDPWTVYGLQHGYGGCFFFKFC